MFVAKAISGIVAKAFFWTVIVPAVIIIFGVLGWSPVWDG